MLSFLALTRNLDTDSEKKVAHHRTPWSQDTDLEDEEVQNPQDPKGSEAPSPDE